jgi:hypothetical protein
MVMRPLWKERLYGGIGLVVVLALWLASTHP